MKRNLSILVIFFALFAITDVQAQTIIKSLEQSRPGQGTVNVYQDPRIEALIGIRSANSGTTEGKVLKTSGYRVQVYAGNNSRAAKEEAAHIASQVKDYFPDLAIYTRFSNPRWICRVGDYRSIEEADAMMRKLKSTGVFKEVSIVKEQINISL